MNRTLLAVLMLFAVATTGCSEDDPVAPREGIYTSMELSADRVVSGDAFDLTVEARNFGPNTVQITFSSSCTFGYRFISADDEMFEVPFTCPGLGAKLTLKPGERYGEDFVVSTFEPPRADWPIDGDRLPPGTYRFQAGLLENDMLFPWAEKTIEVMP